MNYKYFWLRDNPITNNGLYSSNIDPRMKLKFMNYKYIWLPLIKI